MLHVGEGVVDPLSTVVRVEVGESPGGVRFAAKRAKAARTGARRGGVAERSMPERCWSAVIAWARLVDWPSDDETYSTQAAKPTHAGVSRAIGARRCASCFT